MKIKSLLLSALALSALVACQEKQSILTPSQVSVDPLILKVTADGETKTAALTANCEWEVSGPSWVTVAPTSGNGSTSLSIIVAANEGKERDGEVVVAAKDAKSTAKLLVYQAGQVEEPDPDNPPTPPTPDDPTVIKNAEQLLNFVNEASSYTADEVYSIDADIDCGGAKINAIPSFAATLDGKGHKIYNFTVESTDSMTGLILANTGTIKNVIFGSADGSKYDGTSAIKPASGSGGGHAGLVADNQGTLENVVTFVTVNYEANNDPGGRFGIGGLVGNSSVASNIIGCTNNATINASGDITQEGAIGGIIGFAQASDIVVKNCVNAADLVVTMPMKKVLMIGGICGRTNGVVLFDGCENKGAVSYEQTEAPSTWMAIGGIGGVYYNGTKIINCKNSGDISSNLQQASRVAGILGTLNSGGLIQGCVNSGNVTLAQAEPNANWETAAGIVGLQEKDSKDAEGNNRRNIITGNTNTGKVTIKVENTTTHANRLTAAGIIGIGCLDVDVLGNTNKGAISIENKADGDAFCGGIMAMAIVTDVKMEGNVNEGAVSCKTSDDAKSCAGGVVANSGRYPGKSDVTTVTVTGDKNTGAVTCANTAMVGSIAGLNLGTLTNCIAGGSVNGTALTDANFQTLIQGSGSSGSATGTTLAK